MPLTNFEALAEAVTQAMDNYRSALDALVHKTLKDLSANDPEAEFEYGGMGSWGFYRKGPELFDDESTGVTDREIEPDPAYNAIIDAQSEFDISVVPDGHYIYKNKKRLK